MSLQRLWEMRDFVCYDVCTVKLLFNRGSSCVLILRNTHKAIGIAYTVIATRGCDVTITKLRSALNYDVWVNRCSLVRDTHFAHAYRSQLQRTVLKKYVSDSAFENLGKICNCVPRHVVSLALRKLDVEEWLVRYVQRMYGNKGSEAACVLVAPWVKLSMWNWVFTTAFPWAPVVGFGPGSPQLRVPPGKNLYAADDPLIISESLEELQEKLIPFEFASSTARLDPSAY